MKRARNQNLQSLREEMKAVARGERPAPSDAAKPSFNSVEAVVRPLTPDNRRRLALIRDRKPQSVAELVEITGRAQPNLTGLPRRPAARSPLGQNGVNANGGPHSVRGESEGAGHRPSPLRTANPNVR